MSQPALASSQRIPSQGGRVPRRLVAYLRVSSAGQAEGYGLELQEDAVRAAARELGDRVLRVHADEVSGTVAPTGRPGLLAAVTEVREGRADGVIVARLDRLARDLLAQEATIAEVRELGGVVVVADAGERPLLDGDADPTRKLLRQFVGALSEWTAADLRLRLEAGRDKKRAAGGYAGGRPPLGMRAEARELVAYGVEQAAIGRMVALRRVGLSLREIADSLGREGYRTKDGKDTWHPEQVRRALQRIDPDLAQG